jgi:hypothetical protein
MSDLPGQLANVPVQRRHRGAQVPVAGVNEATVSTGSVAYLENCQATGITSPNTRRDVCFKHNAGVETGHLKAIRCRASPAVLAPQPVGVELR